MGDVSGDAVCVTGGDSESTLQQQWYVDYIIACKAALREIQLQRFGKSARYIQFIGLTGKNMFDTQFRRPVCQRSRSTSGYESDLDPGVLEHLEAMAVMDMKSLGFSALIVEIDSAVSQYAVYVENCKPDLRRTFAKVCRDMKRGLPMSAH